MSAAKPWITALYKKRAVAKQEFESLRQELNSAIAKAERVNGDFMSWLNGVAYSRADAKSQNEKFDTKNPISGDAQEPNTTGHD